MIYRGWGLLAVLLPVFCMLIGSGLYGEDGNASSRLMLYSLFVSGILTLIVGVLFRKMKRKHDDLYFIPLYIWGIVWMVVSMIFLQYLGSW